MFGKALASFFVIWWGRMLKKVTFFDMIRYFFLFRFWKKKWKLSFFKVSYTVFDQNYLEFRLNWPPNVREGTAKFFLWYGVKKKVTSFNMIRFCSCFSRGYVEPLDVLWRKWGWKMISQLSLRVFFEIIRLQYAYVIKKKQNKENIDEVSQTDRQTDR